LGKSGSARTKVAIAAAKQLASQGKRVLLAGSAEPALQILLGVPIGSDPQEIAANLHVVQFQTSVLLERSWEDVKKLEAQYLKNAHPQRGLWSRTIGITGDGQRPCPQRHPRVLRKRQI